MSQTTLLQYEAPCTYFIAQPFYLLSRQYRTGPVYALDWCKSSAPGQQLRARSAFRLGIGSISEDYRNRIAIVGLQDERVLVEDDYTDYPDFVTLVEAHHGYPATSLQWQPAAAARAKAGARLRTRLERIPRDAVAARPSVGRERKLATVSLNHSRCSKDNARSWQDTSISTGANRDQRS